MIERQVKESFLLHLSIIRRHTSPIHCCEITVNQDIEKMTRERCPNQNSTSPTFQEMGRTAGGDGLSGLEENGSRSRCRRSPVGAAVAVRVSDERSEELARQDERQPASRSPRPAAKPVHHRTTVKIGIGEGDQ